MRLIKSNVDYKYKTPKIIAITGGHGRFAQTLRKIGMNFKVYYPSKKKLNILNFNSIVNFIKKKKINYLIHNAALSRPMSIHDKEISKSIDLNIIGTANVVKACKLFNTKLIYFSTGYLYEGIKGNYSEDDPIKPINNYAWSKLGGECSVQMYKNSLILRLIMCEKPFLHNKAFFDVETNFMYHDDFAQILPKLLDCKGILNVGGKIQSVYEFAKESNKRIKKISGKKIFPTKLSMNISKLLKIIK